MDTLRSLSVPALVVVGEEDVLTPPADATAMASELVDCRLVVIPDTGHLTPVEAPDAVAVALTHLAVAVEG
jgi:pimeloyl-ACP methyl ester carboxylesterase